MSIHFGELGPAARYYLVPVNNESITVTIVQTILSLSLFMFFGRHAGLGREPVNGLGSKVCKVLAGAAFAYLMAIGFRAAYFNEQQPSQGGSKWRT